ncbi:MAG TPA: P-II family nitrogen regulator [Bdellovibrionota bacterium]|nr:P-II family nitrogen regulator [Bdellovibrionota bacterium]
MNDQNKAQFQLITCIIQRGKGDSIGKAAIAAGAGGATVFFARGMGLRERLGLLGLAIVPEKEVVMIVCTENETPRIFDAVVAAGKLDTPGMGIAYVMPIYHVAGIFSQDQMSHRAATDTADSKINC